MEGVAHSWAHFGRPPRPCADARAMMLGRARITVENFMVLDGRKVIEDVVQ